MGGKCNMYSQVVNVAVDTFGAPGLVMFNEVRNVGVYVADETILADVAVTESKNNRHIVGRSRYNIIQK